MERPYDIDDTGTIHWEHSECDYTSNGDANREGVVAGIAENCEGLCSDCIDADARSALLESAAKKLALLG